MGTKASAVAAQPPEGAKGTGQASNGQRVSPLKQMQQVQTASGEGCGGVSSSRILKQSSGLYVGYRYIVTFSSVLVISIFFMKLSNTFLAQLSLPSFRKPV